MGLGPQSAVEPKKKKMYQGKTLENIARRNLSQYLSSFPKPKTHISKVIELGSYIMGSRVTNSNDSRPSPNPSSPHTNIRM